MPRRSDPDPDRDELRRRIIGLGERSLRKSYFPELQRRLAELEAANSELEREITERRQAEASLRDSEERYRMAQRLAGIGTWEWRLDTDEFIWSDEIESIWGAVPRNEIANSKDVLDRVHIDDRHRWRDSVRACILHGVEHDLEYRLVFPGGVVRWVHAYGDAVRDESGRVRRMLGVVRDITSAKRTERALVEAAELKQSIVDSLPIGVSIFDQTGRCILVNQAQAEIIGGTTEEILEQNFHTIESWKDSGLYDLALRALQNRAAERTEARLTTTYGKSGHFEIRFLPIDSEIEQMLLVVIDDINERKQAEDDLRASEERYRLLIENAGVFVSVYDRDGVCLMMNPTVAGAFGGSPSDFVGKRLTELHPEAGEAYTRRVRRVIDTGEPKTFDDVVRFGSGELHLLSNVHPMCDAAGDVVAAQIISQDVTDRRRLEEQLAQSQKMEAVGQLAGGVAHDFNNMLGVIMGNTELLLGAIEAGDPRREELEEIEHAAQRSADLTRQLLAFGRRQTLAPKVLDLNRTIDGLLTMFGRLLGEHIELRWRPAPRVWPVRIDPTQLGQVMANLCINARDAIEGNGILDIATENAPVDEQWCSGRAEARPGDFVRLSIRDDGCGMDEATVARIFEPFFTTKGLAEGTGLGLSTVYGIVSQHGGFIDVSSVPGSGTSFDVYLPRVDGVAEDWPSDPKIADGAGTGETILVVEDEPGLLRIAVTSLERLGYTVLAAENGEEALEIVERRDGDVDLLVTDVVMPGMSGKELAEHLVARYPDVRTLFISGYTNDVLADHGVLGDGVAFLQKPFTRATLADTVHEILGR